MSCMRFKTSGSNGGTPNSGIPVINLVRNCSIEFNTQSFKFGFFRLHTFMYDAVKNAIIYENIWRRFHCAA